MSIEHFVLAYNHIGDYMKFQRIRDLREDNDKTQKEIANEIIKGLWGDGTDRVTKLKNAGYTDSQIKSIQKQVNSLLK